VKRCAVPGRADWLARLSAAGCTWHDDGPDGGWRENVAWVLTSEEIALLKQTTAEVAELYRQAVDHVLRRNLWARLGFGEETTSILRSSLECGEPALLGRFDFLIDDTGQPRLVEFNADNALSLVETAVLQRDWQQAVMPEHEQWNGLHASLVQAWTKSGPQRVHCAWRPRHAEVEGTARYMARVIREAGLDAELTALHSIGWHRRRAVFVDATGRDLECCWKIYPWEWMLTEPFAAHLRAAPCRFVEPAWRLLPGHKGMLSVLWELFPDHPAILRCSDERPAEHEAWVSKPVLGREGGNVTIQHGGQVVEESGGEFARQARVYQEYVAAAVQDGFLAQCGVWMCGREPVALGIRETKGRIITGESAFVPHVISRATALVHAVDRQRRADNRRPL
jgi:glutathionylspermidine synthase